MLSLSSWIKMERLICRIRKRFVRNKKRLSETKKSLLETKCVSQKRNNWGKMKSCLTNGKSFSMTYNHYSYLMQCIPKYWSPLHIRLHLLLIPFRLDQLLLPFGPDLWLLSVSYGPEPLFVSFSFWQEHLFLSLPPDLLLLSFYFWHHVVLEASPCVYCFLLLLLMLSRSSTNVSSTKYHQLPVPKHVLSVISL